MSSTASPTDPRHRGSYASCGAFALLMLVMVVGYFVLAYGPSAVVAHVVTTARPSSSTEPVPASPHLALGTPVDGDPSDDDLVVRAAYVLDYNRPMHGANWTAWRLEAGDLGGEDRHHGFLPEPGIPAREQVVESDYDRVGYDRGHLAPSSDRTSDRAANEATFLLGNVLPMVVALNRGPWEALEKYSRRLAKQGSRLFITAGPLYGPKPETMGEHAVPVPVSFWKVVVVLPAGAGAEAVDPGTRVLSVVMPNGEGLGHRWSTYQTTLGEVERRSGYRMLGSVPEPVRARLRAKIDMAER